METVRSKLFGEHDPYANFNVGRSDLQGWASTSEAFEKCINDIKPKLIVEVGTWKGASAVHMARTCLNYYNDFEIVCIDTFLGSVEHWTGISPYLPKSSLQFGRAILYEQFLSNAKITNLDRYLTPFPIDSINGGLTLMKLGVQADLVYIDAGHEYQSVAFDLQLYKNLVRPGGYLLGDDWFHPPIKEAVRDTLGEVQTLSHDKFLWVRP